MQEGSVLEEFKEVDEVKEIIGEIGNIYNDQIAVEMAVERFIVIVDEYQEQPHLLDPHLESMIATALQNANDPSISNEGRHLVFKLLYFITKTRGYKVIVRLMPHEVADLEPVLALLDKQSPTDFLTWETRYMLLLWLSMVSMIPFDMSRLDSVARTQGVEGMKPTMDRIIDQAKKYLEVSDKCRDAASYMLSRFLTRHDVRDKKLAEFLDYSLVSLNQANSTSMRGIMCLLGVLRTLALLFKNGKREDLIGYAGTVLKMVDNPDLKLKDSINTVVRKLSIKLIQRLGLTFLKARVAAWRYQRGNRSLADTLSTSAVSSQGSNSQSATDEDDEYDIPDEVEVVIEQLLMGLRDKDTIVRWSAAKGIGRVLGRLPRDLADEVVGSIVEMFTIAEGDTAWHGGCLALAELGRRGLLLPHRLPEVVPIILKALVYDETRGHLTVGAHVRDAACYVCWAFARAYDPEEIKLYVNKIAVALVILSVFEREVNVRRAAAAAFQENVGRQGQFPHGIDILTTCDYFAVGNRNSCFLELSVYVAQFPEYTVALIEHLIKIKILHRDKEIRELSAEALYNLTEKSPEHMAQTVLPQLVTMTTNIDLNMRHGAILSAACVTHALSTLSASGDQHMKKITKIADQTLQGLKDLCPKLKDGKLFLGVGGELMREAVCFLINKLSLSHCPFHNDPVLADWQELVDDCMQHLQEEVRAAAIKAIPAFYEEYYRNEDGKVKPELQEKIIARYLEELKSNTEQSRQGSALAIGSLPSFMVRGQLRRVLRALTQASVNTEKGKRWAEAQRDAVKAITSLCRTVGVNKEGNPDDCVCPGNIDDIYSALFHAMKDYTMDNRGDVGALIREATMTGLHDLTSMLVKVDQSLVSDDICRQVFCSLVQQSCEKIDRTRAHSGQIFIQLLYHDPPIKHIPRQTELVKIFVACDVLLINWANPSNTFPRFVQLLAFPEYAYSVLLGLAVSVGGLTESLVKYSAGALRDHLRSIINDREKIDDFSSTLLRIFKDYQKVDRVTLPFLKMLDQLLAIGCFSVLIEEEGNQFGNNLYALCKEEISRCGEPQKLLASVDVFCDMLIFRGPVQRQIVFQLMLFLCHRYPIVRKTTANKLYEAMVMFDDLVPEDKLDDTMTTLSETEWDQPVEEIRPIRNGLCDDFGVNRPVMKSKTG